MNSQAGWYWIAVAAFALGLTNNLANGGGRKLQNAVEHSVQTVQNIADRIVGHVESLEVALSDKPNIDIRTAVIADNIQQRVACERSRAMRQQATVARLQLSKIRIAKLEPMQNLVIEAPKVNFKVRTLCSGTDDKRERI
jgi:hypothetical protein